MKKIIVKSISYSNFKGAKSKNFELKSARNHIEGKNGVGKTTLAEAIKFALYGKGLFDERVLNEPIKNGEIIKDYVQLLSIVLDINGVINTITKEITKGSLSKMIINDIPYKKKRDFDDEIVRLVGVESEEFTLLSNPKYFNSITNKKAREYIFKLIDVENEEKYIDSSLIKKNPQFITIIKENFNKGINVDAHIEIKSGELKGIKESLNNFDISIRSKEETLKKISDIETEDINYEELKKKSIIIEDKINLIQFDNDDLTARKIDNQKKTNSLDIAVLLLKDNKKKSIKLSNELSELKIKYKKAQDDYDKVNAKEPKDKCGVCGTVTDKTKDLGEKFKQSQLELMEDDAAVMSVSMNNISKEQLSISAKNIKLDQEIELLEKEISFVDVEPIKGYSELQEELNGVVEAMGSFNALKILKEEIDELNDGRSKEKVKHDNITAELEILLKIFKNKAKSIEDNINGKLKDITIKLFETKKNGNIKDVFTILKDGIDFSRLNNASQINAGVELLNFIQLSKDISLPIFIDNAESVNNLQYTNSQTIELYVSKGELVVK